MHIFIATDGSLDVDKTATMVARLHEPGDDVSIVTAIQFPREFLSGIAKATGVSEVAKFAHEAGAGVLGIAGGAKAAEKMSSRLATPPQEQHPLNTYFSDTARQRTDGLRTRLGELGVDAVAAWVSTENQTARTILSMASKNGADLLIIGAHGRGRFEGPLGSTVTKIVRRAKMQVLIVR
jgi:nucleotide-binding universal stress UspA family protein